MSSPLEPRPKYVLGIDLGSSSLGWALIGLDELDRPKSLIRTGVRIFKPGVTGTALEIQEGKDKSKALDRRTARLHRRQVRRRAYRQGKLFQLLQEQGLLPKSNLSIERSPSDERNRILTSLDLELDRRWNNNLPQSGFSILPLYLLRKAALDKRLEPHEIGRILYHLSQRRGFKSNRKGGEKDATNELGAVKAGIAELSEKMMLTKARTLGEYLADLDPHQSGQNVRRRWTLRKMYEDEFAAIWNKQASFNPELLNEPLRKAISHWLFFQRPLAAHSHLIGKCELEGGNHRRAAWATLEAQRFRVLQKVNDLQVRYAGSLAAQPLTTSERKLAFDLLDRDGNQTFSSLRRALKLNKNSKFNLEMGDEKLLRGNNTNKTMLSVFGERWDHLSEDEKKQIVELWRTTESEETLIRRAMRDWGLDEIAAQQLAVANPEDGYCPLSRKAIERLLPLMFEGMSFKDAKRREYGSHSSGGQVLDQLPPLHVHRGLKGTAHSDIFASNFYLAPTCDQAIKRALTEMRKVVNAIVREHGKPHEVHIELARELKKTRKERKRLTGKNRQRKRDRDAAKADLLRNCGIQNPSHADMEKALLLAECCGICPYSGRSISLEDLFGELQEFDVEHIIPLSRYPDDSFQNKTLCWRRENHAMKHDKLPFEAYGADPIRWEEMQLRVKAWKPANPAKLERFVIRSENELEDFIARRMNDTRYASILSSRLLELFYGGRDVETQSGPRQVIFTSSGSVTATLRRKWQLERILHEALRSNSSQSTGNPRTDYRHHAIDAVTIALARQAVVQSLRRSASINPHSQLEVRAFHNITSPWPQFVESIRPHIEALVVSHRPEHKMGGELHDESNYGKPYVSNGKTIVHIRKPVSGLTAKDIESIVDPVVRSAVQQKAERLNGDLSKCESANDWPVLLSRSGKSIPIKRVRISKVLDVRPVGDRERQRFVATTNNHHMAIFELLRNEQDAKWEGIPVSLYEVMERKRKRQALINRSHPNGDPWKFKFSLMGGDTLELHRKCDHEKNICKPEIYRIRAIAANGQLSLAKVNDARTKKQIQQAGEWWTPRADALRKLGGRKVSIDPLGKVHPAND